MKDRRVEEAPAGEAASSPSAGKSGAHPLVGDPLEGEPLRSPTGVSWSDEGTTISDGPPSFDGELDLGPDAPYAVLERLGEGGMGLVYRAHDRARDTEVALKTLHRLDEVGLARLKREFRAAADLSHPNLVSLHELRVEEGIPYFTMELVDGMRFLDFVRGPDGEAGPLDEAGLRRLRDGLKQLVQGVARLHTGGWLHRDLKPANVLVETGGRVVLLDFGLVVDPRSARRSTRAAGTPAYMAPEQARLETLTAAADWFSVGVMLFEALTGERPAAADASQPPPRPSEVVTVPDDLDALCARLLAPSPADRPTSDELLQALRVAPPVSLNRGDLPLVGRQAELATLRRAFDDTLDGRLVVAHVQGRSGVGKSALVRELLDEVRGRALVLESRCRERESFAYKAVDGLVDGLVHWLVGLEAHERDRFLRPGLALVAPLFPALRAITTPTAPSSFVDRQLLRRRGFAELKALLARVAERHALVLAIDDLQWGDADSADLLEELVAEPAPPMLVVCTSRRENADAPSVRARWLQAKGLDRRDLALEPLSFDHSLELVRAASHGSLDEETLAHLARESTGSPFFIDQLVSEAQNRRATQEALSLDELVTRRVAQLDPDPRRLLEVIAVAGQPIERGIALAIADPAQDPWASVSSLREGRFVRTHGTGDVDPVEVWHDRIREAVVASLSASALTARHRELAEHLVAQPDVDPARLAFHFGGAGQRREAGKYALAAAERARGALAFERAARFYQLALDYGAKDRPTLLRLQADALVDAGRCADAAPLYLRAARESDRTTALRLRSLAAEQLMASGHVDDGLAELEPVLSALSIRFPKNAVTKVAYLAYQFARLELRGLEFEPRDAATIPQRTLLQIDTCWAAGKGLLAFDPIRAAHFLLQALRLALAAGERSRAVRFLPTYGMMIAFDGDEASLRKGSAIIDEAAASAPDDRFFDGILAICRGTAAMSAGAWSEARKQLELGIVALEDGCANIRWECSTARSSLLNTFLSQGDLPAIRDHAPRWKRDAQRVGDHYDLVTNELYCAILELADDAPEEARKRAAAAIAKWSRTGFHFQHWLAAKIEIWCHLYADRLDLAQRRLAAIANPLRWSGLTRIRVVAVDVHLLRGRVAVAQARRDGSRRSVAAVARCRRALDRIESPMAQAASSLLQLQHGAPPRDVDLARATAAGFDRAGAMFHALAARRLVDPDAADAAVAALGVASPERWARLWVDGGVPTR